MERRVGRELQVLLGSQEFLDLRGRREHKENL